MKKIRTIAKRLCGFLLYKDEFYKNLFHFEDEFVIIVYAEN